MQIYSASRRRISGVVVNNCAVLKSIWRLCIVSAERCLRPQHSIGMYQLSNWFSLFRLKWDISIKLNWITFHITDIQSMYEPNFLHRRHNGNKAVNIGALWRLKHVYFLGCVACKAAFDDGKLFARCSLNGDNGNELVMENMGKIFVFTSIVFNEFLPDPVTAPR